MNIHNFPLPLTVSQKLRKAILQLQPVAYYPLDEQSGSVARNRAPQTQGTLNGTITGATIGQAGKVGRAYSFDGEEDFINLGNPTALQLTTQSFMCLIKTTEDNGGYIFSTRDNTTGAISWYNATTGKLQIARGTSTGATAINAHNNGAWHCLVGTWLSDGNTAFFLDGIANGTTTTITTLGQTAERNIGARGETNGAATYLTATLQHVALFNRALSATEILKLARIAGLA